MTTVVRKEMPSLKREIMLIPGWAFAIAVLVFVLVPACFFMFVKDAPMPLRILMGFLPGTALAFLALMVGYVNRDAGRRGMSRALWTVLVLVIPNAIGFILYFLLRSPLRLDCPKCGAIVDPSVNFCPSCRYNFHPTCPQCSSTVQPGDTFCANCGTQLNQIA